MDSLISSYGINFQAFQIALSKTHGIVAGSSALAAYLKQEGIDPGFTPNDIDIFVPGQMEHARDNNGHLVAGQYVIKSLKKMTDFLASYNFYENDKFDSNDTYYTSLTAIQKVTSFTNYDGKEIQVIVIDTYNLIAHICNDFDLSVCISWYDVRSNSFKTFDSDTTKRKEIYQINIADTDELKAKEKHRIEKYIDRGFKLVEKPCSFVDTRDTRDQLSHKKFEGLNVMDIFTLDEMPIVDYLQKSAWNIVLKAGETYYAFERNALMDYMKKKTTNIYRIGAVCETPLNQCITLEGFYQLRYADYSIYELKSAYSVPIDSGRVKSMFHLNCYSIKNWIDGKKGGIVQMPPEHLTQPLTTVKRIIRRGEPLPPQPGARAHLPEIGVDDILAAHAHLMEPGNLEAFHTALRENNYQE